NRSAIGARVVARYGNRTHAQEVQAQSSFYSANDRRLHFGLAPATSADLTIRWPNGATEKVPGVHADQLVVVREGAGIVRRDRFGRQPRAASGTRRGGRRRLARARSGP